MADMTIRKATIDDVDLIIHFIKKLAEYERLEKYVEVTPERLRQFGFNEKYFQVIFAELDGTPVGMALYFFTFSTFVAKPSLYLEDLIVLQDYRHQGIGKVLFKALAEIAIENECGRIDWSVLDWNESAIRFYESLGAERIKGWNLNRLDEKAIQKLMK